MRDPPPAIFAEVLFGQLCVLVQLDPGADDFAELPVRNAEYLDVADRRMGKQELFDLTRVDILAAANDEVLYAPNDVAITFLVYGREVSPVCIQPASSMAPAELSASFQ